MSGNLSGTYESFLARCIAGVRKEQEAFREFENLTRCLKDLEIEENALGLKKQLDGNVEAELTEAYLKGRMALEKEGDVYSVLAPLGNLVRHREEMLAEEKHRKHLKSEQKREQEERRQREKQISENRKYAKRKLVKYSRVLFVFAVIIALFVCVICLPNGNPLGKALCCLGIDWCTLFSIPCILHMKRAILPCLNGGSRCTDLKQFEVRGDLIGGVIIFLFIMIPSFLLLANSLNEGAAPLAVAILTAGTSAFCFNLLFEIEGTWCRWTAIICTILGGGWGGVWLQMN